MIHILLLVFLFALQGCGGLDMSSFDSLISRQPHIVSVEPTGGSVVKTDSIIALEFSEPMDTSSINASSLAIVKEDESQSTGESLVESVVDGKVVGMEGVYKFEGEGRVAIFRSAKPYDPGASYSLVATDKMVSVDMLPLNSGRVGSQKAYVSKFTVEGQSAENGSSPDAGGTESQGAAVNEDQPAEEPIVITRPTTLVINELLYDVPGDDTNGLVFIELAGDPETDISGYKISFVEGDDGAVKESIDIPENSKISADGIFLIADSMTGQSGVTQVAGAHFIDNFDPPNGPDCVQLLDDSGKLIDALGYGTPIKSPTQNGLACFEGVSAAKASPGQSLSRTDSVDTGDNSKDFKPLISPTPGVM